MRVDDGIDQLPQPDDFKPLFKRRTRRFVALLFSLVDDAAFQRGSDTHRQLELMFSRERGPLGR